MQRLMQTKFVPSDHAERAYKEYLNLRQGSRSVADYTAEFHRLSLRVQIVETEHTLDQASSYAMNIEETLKRKHETRVPRGDASHRPKSSFPTRGASSSKLVESRPIPPSPSKGEQSGPAYNTRLLELGLTALISLEWLSGIVLTTETKKTETENK
ncbi:hypothetical protein EJ110_NYTH31377 [Nymphaea thermarum]|nr:hypothetical protein EJ110_NYTH31377 [Nymphaea thermarum]